MLDVTTYVVTNFRFDDEFRNLCMAKVMDQTPIPLECEEMFSDAPPQTTTFNVIIEQVSNPHHVFTCIGRYDSGSCRIEEENGTLYLSVI